VAHSSLPELAVGGLPAAAARLAAAGLVFLAAWGLGSALLRLPVLRDAEPAGSRGRTLAALGIGLAGLSVIALALSPLELLRSWALVAIVVSLGVAGMVAIARSARGPHAGGSARRAVDLPRGALEIGLVCAIVAGTAFALIAALAPEVEYDALWYHLDLPRQALDSGSLVSDRCEYVSYYPMGAELLYAYGLALGNAVIAKLVSFGVYLLFVVATYDLGTRVGSRRTALVAAAVAALTPSVLWEGTTAYVDVTVGLFLTLSLSSALRHVESGRIAPLALAGLLGGFALAVKTLAAIGIAAIALVVIAGRRAPLRARATSLALFGGLALVPALPWLVRAQVETGNPVFPSLYGVFGADDSVWTKSAADAYESALDRIGHVDGLTGLLKLPWDITMHSSRFAGCIGVLFLMLVPLAFTRRPSRLLGMVALFAGAYVALWVSPPSSQQLRFLLPVVPALAVVAAHGLEAACGLAAGLHPRARAVPAVVVVATLALSIPAFTAIHDRDGELTLTHVLRGAPADVVTGAESEADYLTRRLPAYAAARGLRQGGRVVALTDPYVNLYAAPSLIPDWSLCIPLAGARVGDARSEARALRRLGVDRLLVEPGLRTEQGSLALVRKPPPAGTARVVYDDERAVVYRLLPGG
jgi:4-amino-4-deoxy-L-arabinose transferase-like glycosyltransferase